MVLRFRSIEGSGLCCVLSFELDFLDAPPVWVEAPGEGGGDCCTLDLCLISSRSGFTKDG